MAEDDHAARAMRNDKKQVALQITPGPINEGETSFFGASLIPLKAVSSTLGTSRAPYLTLNDPWRVQILEFADAFRHLAI